MPKPTKQEIEEQAIEVAKMLEVIKTRSLSFARRAFSEFNEASEKSLHQKKVKLEITLYSKLLARINGEIQRKSNKAKEEP